MTWHRPARLFVGCLACASAVGAYLTITGRPATSAPPRITRADPTASIEGTGAILQRVRASEEQFQVRADRTLTYQDGSTRQYGVRVSVRNKSGKDFVVTAAEARAGKDARALELSGDVSLAATDGFELRAPHATYNQDSALVTATGAVTFRKERLSGAATGMSYATDTEVLTLAADPVVRLAPADGEGAESEGMEFRSGAVTLDRVQHVLTLNPQATIVRGRQTIEGDSIVVRLSEDEQGVTLIELRGHSRVSGTGGSLRSMASRDMDLDYADDGVTLERAVLTGDAVVMAQASGADGRDRRFAGGLLELQLDAEGNVQSATGRDGVRIELPGESAADGQTVVGREFQLAYGALGVLSEVRVTGDVQFRESRRDSSRAATGQSLRLGLANDAVTSATFGGGAKFDEGGIAASAGDIQYDLRGGRLILTGGDVGATPRMADERLTVTAQDRIEVTLGDRTDVRGVGAVKTILRPARAGTTSPGQRLPGLLSADQVVNINAETVTSARDGAQMTYTGTATLSQGETALRADSIVIDREEGSLTAVGAARVALSLSDGAATGRANRIRFEDRSRTLFLESPPSSSSGRSATAPARSASLPAASAAAPVAASATPAPAAAQSYLSASHGEVRADKVALILAPATMATDRLEANGQVSLKLATKSASGQRLLYVASDERYELTGTAAQPVSVVESCRATTGKTLIFYRSADRILVDGNDETRTQTKGVGSCGPTAR